MAGLTDADKAKFEDDVISALQASKTELIAKEWDPTSRITNLGNGVTSIAGAKLTLDSANLVQENAQKGWRKVFDDNYNLASASVGSMEGALGKDHSAVKALHGARGAMHQSAPAPKPKT